MALHGLGRYVLLGLMSVSAVLFCISSMAQSTVPLPSKRPPDLTPEAPEPPATSPLSVQPIPEDNDTLRAQVLESRRLVGEALPPVNDNGGC